MRSRPRCPGPGTLPLTDPPAHSCPHRMHRRTQPRQSRPCLSLWLHLGTQKSLRGSRPLPVSLEGTLAGQLAGKVSHGTLTHSLPQLPGAIWEGLVSPGARKSNFKRKPQASVALNQEAATVPQGVKGEVVGPTQEPWGLLGSGPKSSTFKQLSEGHHPPMAAEDVLMTPISVTVTIRLGPQGSVSALTVTGSSG